MPLRNLAKYLGGLILAVALLWWVLRGTDPQAVWGHVAGLPTSTLVLGLGLACLLNLGHNLPRVWRWRALLEPVRRDVPFRPMFDSVILGYMTTWIVPGRLGELVRPALLSGREQLPLGPCLGSVFADRVMDALAVLALFAVGVAFTPLAGDAAMQADAVRNTSLLVVAIVATPFVLLLIAGSRREWFESRLRGRTGIVAWIGRSMLAFASGTEALRTPRLFLRIGVNTLAAWTRPAKRIHTGTNAPTPRSARGSRPWPATG